jgi:hypothetical protein
MNLRQAMAPVVVLMLSGAALAETYEVSVTRKDRNLYRVDGKPLLIQTKYCYEYAYSEVAFLKWQGYGGKLIFVDSEASCDVKAVFQKTTPEAGKYAISVRRESDDWYQVDGGTMYLKTSMCLSLALGEDAYLNLESDGSGRLVFENGGRCSVEAIYIKARLP